MRYLLMLYADEKAGAAIPKELMAKAMESMYAYEAALTKAGAHVANAALVPTWEARTIRMEGGTVTRKDDGSFVNEGGELKVHDGPYADTREQLGGYYIIEAASMDEAIEWAKKCPGAQWGSVEVRPYNPGYQPK
jgi:hypothetical protein